MCFLVNFLFSWSIHRCEWGIKVSHYYCVIVNFPLNLILNHKTTPGQRIFVSHFQSFFVLPSSMVCKVITFVTFCLSVIYFTFSFSHRTRLVCEVGEFDRKHFWWGRLREYNTLSLQKLMSNAVDSLFNSPGKAQTVPVSTGRFINTLTFIYSGKTVALVFVEWICFYFWIVLTTLKCHCSE